ncbi:MAG: hypothetical protein M1826_001984 [Phylliscum demangeonii]|nr:MAG: hypothetical protein M1826_001984 [Phylliscum demangeonii]
MQFLRISAYALASCAAVGLALPMIGSKSAPPSAPRVETSNAEADLLSRYTPKQLESCSACMSVCLLDAGQVPCLTHCSIQARVFPCPDIKYQRSKGAAIDAYRLPDRTRAKYEQLQRQQPQRQQPAQESGRYAVGKRIGHYSFAGRVRGQLQRWLKAYGSSTAAATAKARPHPHRQSSPSYMPAFPSWAGEGVGAGAGEGAAALVRAGW